MVDNDSIKNLQFQITNFDKKISNINLQENANSNKYVFDELDQMYKKLYDKIEDYDNELQDSSMTSNTKPLISKLSQIKTDL